MPHRVCGMDIFSLYLSAGLRFDARAYQAERLYEHKERRVDSNERVLSEVFPIPDEEGIYIPEQLPAVFPTAVVVVE